MFSLGLIVTQSSDALVPPTRIGPSLVIGSLSINILSLALPLVLLQIFDRIIPNAATDTLFVLFCGLLIALAMEFVLKICRIVLLSHDSTSYEIDLTRAACKKILETDSFAFSQESLGTHVDRMAAISQLRDYNSGQGRLLAIDLPFTAIFIGMIWYIGGWLVLVPIGCLLTILAVSFGIRFLQTPVILQRQSVDRRRNSFMIEVLSRITTVKALAAEEQMLRRFELLQTQSASATRGLIWVSSLSQTFGSFVGQGAVVAMGALGAYLNIISAIGMAELAACMLLNGRTIQPMLKLLGIWAQQESLQAAKVRISEIAALKSTVKSGATDNSFEPTLVFENVTLHPKERQNPIFENLSFRVEKGQIAAIVGADGGGKSSILRMILGEQDATLGQIRIGEESPGDVLHRRQIGEVAYVDQDPVIFKGTVLENLSLFGDIARQDAALHAAQRIGLDAEVLKMPLGYETEIGPGAKTVLPVGLQQKICIARVLGRRPSLLLFNNAASAIDGSARKEVANAILALKGLTTTVLISRRLLKKEDFDVEINLSPEGTAPSSFASLREWFADAEAERSPIKLSSQKRVAI